MIRYYCLIYLLMEVILYLDLLKSPHFNAVQYKQTLYRERERVRKSESLIQKPACDKSW